MGFFKKHPNLIKISCVASISGCAAWLYYQVQVTKSILSNALDTSILSISEPTVVERPIGDDFVVLDNIKDHERQDLSLESKWNNLKFFFAKRLLILANNDNKYIRKKAVRQLARIKNLDYFHCSLLRHMIDARTAVGLARTSNADCRFFVKPPMSYFSHTHDMIVTAMKDFLVKLHEKSQHPCMSYFISKAFAEFHEMDRITDHEHTSMELKKYIQSSQDVLPLCLESLLHHASVTNYAKDIAELDGLPLLMEIYDQFKDNPAITAVISRIISYLSMHYDLLEELHISGWIGILAEWVNHDDVRISIPAAKALANLDSDEEPVYLQRLYPLHPSTRTVHELGADVVFIHGLLGGVFFTWRQRKKQQDPLGFFGKKGKPESLTPGIPVFGNVCPRKKKPKCSDHHVQEYIDNLEEHLCYQSMCKDYEIVWEDIPSKCSKDSPGPYSCPGYKYPCYEKFEDDCYTSCWPRDWLAEDCDHLRIIGVNYETNLSMWTPICPVEKVKTLEDRSHELIRQMIQAGLGKRPIIWVCHSMGGLMVKSLLNQAYSSAEKKTKNLCLKTRGIVFYSTPHIGSSVAKFNPASALVLWPSIEVQELQENSPKLIEIQNEFLEVVKNVKMKIVSFVETKPTVVSAMKIKFLVVEPHSGNLGCGEYYEIPLDHLGICKPASRHSFLYQKVLYMIQDILNEEN